MAQIYASMEGWMDVAHGPTYFRSNGLNEWRGTAIWANAVPPNSANAILREENWNVEEWGGSGNEGKGKENKSNSLATIWVGRKT